MIFIILSLFCIFNALQCYSRLGIITPSWLFLWILAFVNFLELMPSRKILLYFSRKVNTIGASYETAADLDNWLTEQVEPNHTLAWIGIVQVVCFVTFMVPSLVRYVLCLLRVHLYSYHTDISHNLLKFKYNNIINKYRYFYLEMLIELLIRSVIYACVIHAVFYVFVSISYYCLIFFVWTTLWFEEFIYHEMTIEALTADIKTIGLKYNSVFKERFVAHFWAYYLGYPNTHTFGSMYLSARRETHSKHNKNNIINIIVPFPWINYALTYFSPSLFEIQGKFNATSNTNNLTIKTNT
jgi:hypothetical protein